MNEEEWLALTALVGRKFIEEEGGGRRRRRDEMNIYA